MDGPSLSALLDAPSFTSVRVGLSRLLDAERLDVSTLDARLAAGARVRFEAQTQVRKRGEPFCSSASYDGSITVRGVVPTREGSMHDLMNALVWSAFPRSKRQIHARQYDALLREVVEGDTALPGRRSRLRDRLSMLDEGGVVAWASADHEEVESALTQGDSAHAAALARAGSLHHRVLGHAILEHVARGEGETVRGCVVLVAAPRGGMQSEVDDALAAALAREGDALEAWIARLPSIELRALTRAPRP